MLKDQTSRSPSQLISDPPDYLKEKHHTRWPHSQQSVLIAGDPINRPLHTKCTLKQCIMIFFDPSVQLWTLPYQGSRRSRRIQTVIRATRTKNLIRCWRLQIATQQVMTLVICNTIQTSRTFPSRRTAGAHPVKKVFQAPAAHSAMLLAIPDLMSP